jgi:pilus assembly protein Flp/PilA
MISSFRRFLQEEKGATAIEYGLIASLIAVVIIGAVTAVGNGLTNTFTEVSNNLHRTLARRLSRRAARRIEPAPRPPAGRRRLREASSTWRFVDRSAGARLSRRPH